MKQLINRLYYSAVGNLETMRKSNMTLCERIKYEKALVELKNLKDILDQYSHPPL